MRILLITSTLLLCFCSCIQKKQRVVYSKVVSDVALPSTVIGIYEDEAGLSKLNEGVDSFEIRMWHPFYFTDSFPTILNRVYLLNGKLRRECYLFMNKNVERVRAINDLEGLKFVKYELVDDPSDISIDSLMKDYDLSKFQAIDLSLFEKYSLSNPFTTATPRHTLFEQATPDSYYAIFIPNPLYYPEINPAIDSLGRYYQLVQNYYFEDEPEFKKWFETNLNKIYRL